MKVYLHIGGGLDERETVYVDREDGGDLAIVHEAGALYSGRVFTLPGTAVELATPAAVLEQMLERVWADDRLAVGQFEALLSSVANLPGGPEAIESGDWEGALAAYREATA